jgi:predicted RNase H-like HicB family nuclease
MTNAKAKPGFVTAVYVRDHEENVWLIELKEEPRVHSFGRTLEAAEKNIRDAARLWFGGDVNLKHEYHGLSDETLRLRELAMDLGNRAAELQADAMSAKRFVATLMASEGVSRRDAARLLGLSHQRLQQLIEEAETRPAPSPEDIGRWDRGRRDQMIDDIEAARGGPINHSRFK